MTVINLLTNVDIKSLIYHSIKFSWCFSFWKWDFSKHISIKLFSCIDWNFWECINIKLLS